MLLEPATLEHLERLALRTRGRLSGSNPGEHRSRRLGSSVDFADWRPYVPGDDFRRIDYQILARLDRLLVRLYEAEEELNLRIVVDASASMSFEEKLPAALRIAGAFAYLAAVRHDRARVWISDHSGVRPSPWAASRGSAMALLEWLESVEPGGPSSLSIALNRLSTAGGFRGLTVLISDLLSEDWEASLRRLSGPGSEAVVIHLVARAELDPALRGDLLLVDSESEATLEVSLSEQVLSDYRRRAERWLQAVREACRSRGTAYFLVHPDEDLETLLLRRVRSEGVLR